MVYDRAFCKAINGFGVSANIVGDGKCVTSSINCDSLAIKYSSVKFNNREDFDAELTNLKESYKTRVLFEDSDICLSQAVRCVRDEFGMMEIVEVGYFDKIDIINMSIEHIEAKNPLLGFFKIILDVEGARAESIVKNMLGEINLRKARDGINLMLTNSHISASLGKND